MTRSVVRQRQRGQVMVLFVLSLGLFVLATGLVIDAGYGFVQRREAQTAADFSAIAGTRLVMASVVSPGSYSDSGVATAVRDALSKNGMGASPSYTATYVDASGNPISGGSVGSQSGGAIPASARGVLVTPSVNFHTFFLGETWTASATATARGGFSPTTTAPAGDLLPIGINFSGYSSLKPCAPGLPASDPSCSSSFLDLGTGTGPGQFGWLAWSGFSENDPDLVRMLTPPLPSPVLTVPVDGYLTISGNTGKSNGGVPNAIANLASTGAIYLVPILSPGTGDYPGTTTPYPPTCAGGGKCNGSKAQVNIIGFAGFQLTGCLRNPCIGDIQGVLRKEFFLGPTGAGGSSTDVGSSVAIQLVR